MKTYRNAQAADRGNGGIGARMLLAALLLGFVGLAQAAPLNLMLLPEPDISSGLVTVGFDASANALTASGIAQQLTTGGAASDIVGGSFDLAATVLGDGSLTGGSLSIGGTVAGLGYTSGTLLTGTLSTIGFDDAGGDPLEFLFDVTGGDAAALYGSLGGIILNFTGFGGDWTSDFSGGAMQSSADVGVVPVPAAVWLFGSALLGLLGVNAGSRRMQTA